jgi:hypothetical protein
MIERQNARRYYMRHLLALLVAGIALGTCGARALPACRSTSYHRIYRLADDLQGEHLHCIATDSHGNTWFVTSEPDTLAEQPISSSSQPAWFYLVAYSQSDDSFQTIATGIPCAQKAVFDLRNQLWLMTSDSLYRWSDRAAEEALSAGSDAFFNAIAVDSSNAIWVSMWPKGIYRLAVDGTISHYPSMTSQLLDYGARDIHTSVGGSIWIALTKSVIHVHADAWEQYELPIGNAQAHGASCLTTDGAGDVWVGIGGKQADTYLLRFDGREWHVVNVWTPDGARLSNAVIREIVSDGQKLWVLLSVAAAESDTHGVLTTFDGSRWAEVPGLEAAVEVHDIQIDGVHRVVWVGATELEGGEYRTLLHGYSY